MEKRTALIQYSKPLTDIRQESRKRFLDDSKESRRQWQAYKSLQNLKKRTRCVLCANALSGSLLNHRSVVFVECKNCGHIQTQGTIPEKQASQFAFHQIYPKLNPKDYADRKRRIYQPKLDWITKSLRKLGYSKQWLKTRRWFEIGSGAGYFLSVLHDFGVRQYGGLDGDSQLIQTSNSILPLRNAILYQDDISHVPAVFKADIYVAFFVLEHLKDVHGLLLQLKKCPKNTVFVFSVPVFGFSAILEGVFKANYARSLDGIVHQQIYTEKSIRHAMKIAGFKVAAEWVFGQDADDLTRFTANNVQTLYSLDKLNRIIKSLTEQQDSVQACIDRLHFSDQRHVIAIKQ